MEPPTIDPIALQLRQITETLNKVQRELWVLATKMENKSVHPTIDKEIQAPPFSPDSITGLSNGDIQLLKHLSYGKTNDEIASVLNLSPNTVATYRKRILKKLNLKNTAQLVRFTLENKLG